MNGFISNIKEYLSWLLLDILDTTLNVELVDRRMYEDIQQTNKARKLLPITNSQLKGQANMNLSNFWFYITHSKLICI